MSSSRSGLRDGKSGGGRFGGGGGRGSCKLDILSPDMSISFPTDFSLEDKVSIEDPSWLYDPKVS